MDIDLGEATLDELKVLQREIGKAIGSFEARQRQAALADVVALLKARDMTLHDLFGAGAAPAKPTGMPKYRHPENPDVTWTGRRRRPDWIRAALARGQAMEAFLVG